MRLLLRAFPAGFRRRYGDELLELVSAGDAPLRDAANLIVAGLRVRLGQLARDFRSLRAGRQALALGAIALAATGSAALGGCVVLGSVAVTGMGALLAQRARGVVALAR